jgi:hydrogenase-4 component F
MHTWLPDAHSEAPTPISALLSGVLLKCSFYGILRLTILVNESVDNHFTSQLLLFFGIFSMGIAVPFILVQKNIKRLLAYSSIEHMGIITIATAFASPLAIFAALLHLLNHAVTKALMFFIAGNLVLKYQTKEIDKMSRAIGLMPVTGGLLLVGGLALAGSPPFSIFTSEWLVLTAGVQSHEWWASIIFILFLVIIFGSLVYHFGRIAFGVRTIEAGRGSVLSSGEINLWTHLPLWVLLILIIVLGWMIPGPLQDLLLEATQIVSQEGQLPDTLGRIAGTY